MTKLHEATDTCKTTVIHFMGSNHLLLNKMGIDDVSDWATNH